MNNYSSWVWFPTFDKIISTNALFRVNTVLTQGGLNPPICFWISPKQTKIGPDNHHTELGFGKSTAPNKIMNN